MFVEIFLLVWGYMAFYANFYGSEGGQESTRTCVELAILQSTTVSYFLQVESLKRSSEPPYQFLCALSATCIIENL